jgi:hypothetical protein
MNLIKIKKKMEISKSIVRLISGTTEKIYIFSVFFSSFFPADIPSLVNFFSSRSLFSHFRFPFPFTIDSLSPSLFFISFFFTTDNSLSLSLSRIRSAQHQRQQPPISLSIPEARSHEEQHEPASPTQAHAGSQHEPGTLHHRLVRNRALVDSSFPFHLLFRWFTGMA